MKMRIIKLRPEFLMRILQGKTNSFASNLPDDTELLDIKYDLFSKQVTAVIRSDEFQDVAESYPIQEFDVVYAPEFNVTLVPNSRKSQPAINSRNQPQPRISPEPEIQPLKELRIQSSQDTSDVEKEFSSEQRKLLSFTVKDEYVIVKPIQFLKAEWNDINDVVTSIGGKWVKGDIDSYWAIPRQLS
jgi:hypothetical protein